LIKRLKAFTYAFAGIHAGFYKELALKIHLCAFVILFVLAVCFKISFIETAFLLCSAGLVIAAEVFNTALEKVCDLVSLAQDGRIKYIKDLAAGAVFITLLVAGGVGASVIYLHSR